MWELIKKDPVLKAITIFVVGIFAFAFAFSIMFGTGQSEHSHGAAAGMEGAATGYTAATGFGNIIVMLAKILIIIILVAVIITAVKFIKKHVIGNEPVKGLDRFKNNPLAIPLMGIGGILLLLLAINMLAPASSGTEMMHAGNQSAIGYNGAGLGVPWILYIILKFLSAISLIGLVIGLVMYFKNRYFDSLSVASLAGNGLCSACGKELQASWKCCPNCGTEKKVETNGSIAGDSGKN